MILPHAAIAKYLGVSEDDPNPIQSWHEGYLARESGARAYVKEPYGRDAPSSH